MAYNYFPQYYNSPYLQPPVMPGQAQQAPQVTPQAQNPARNSDFVLVRSEDEARNYPVAFGNTVTFKHENEPYMYTKTMGMSQLDRPVFERYKLVKETAQDAPQTHEKEQGDKVVMEKLQGEIDALWREIDALKKKGQSNARKALDEEGA